MIPRNTLLVFVLCVTAFYGQAQITLTNATFPAAGDSLKTATDLTPVGITVDPPGGPYSWDYTSLSADTRQVTTFDVAANGSAFADFPSAELVSFGNMGAETYYDVSATLFANLGVSGGDVAANFPFVTYVKFVPPFPERRAPTNFFDIHQNTSDFIYSISLDDIPSEVLDTLGIPSGLLDSIRIRINYQRLNVVDAHGTMAIPGGTYNVLRIHDTDYTTVSIDVHTILGWVDISAFGIPLEGIGTDTISTYSYYSDSAKEPIAVMVMEEPDGLIPLQITYKDNGIANAVDFQTRNSTRVVVSPNPASDNITFELLELKPGTHTLELYDAAGRNVMTTLLPASKTNVSLRGLENGLYLYQITDKQRKLVNAGRVVKSDK